MCFLHMSREVLLEYFPVAVIPGTIHTHVIRTLNPVKFTEVMRNLVAENYVVAVPPQTLERIIQRLAPSSKSGKQLKMQHDHALKIPGSKTLMSI
jgi:hypothetical protein